MADARIMTNVPIDAVAWWGAVMGTIALVWEVWRWWRGRAWFRVSIHSNVYYDDSVVAVRATATGEIRELVRHYRIEVVNLGDMPATITSISAVATVLGAKARWRRLRKIPCDFTALTDIAFKAEDGRRLPKVLGPGEVWMCRVKEQAIAALLPHGVPLLHVALSSRGKPIRRRFSIRQSSAGA